MPDTTRIVSPGPNAKTVLLASGKKLRVPQDWMLLPPGDAGLTRRVKAGGPTWTVKEKKRGKAFSRGVWAPRERIESARAALELERATEGYAKKLAAGRRRRERVQTAYVGSFQRSVFKFLAFARCYAELANRLSTAVAVHATPVGSGTVARTQRIPIERRAQAALIAWLRHQTTSYDSMQIGRSKDARREVRRRLADESFSLLQRYRRGEPVDPAECPLQQALKSEGNETAAPPEK